MNACKNQYVMKKILVIIVFLTCYAGTCEKNPFARNVYSIWIENKTDKAITFLVSKKYPDTLLPVQGYSLAGVAPNSKTPYDFQESTWAAVFDNLPADTLSIFIFRGDTIAAYSWPEIRSGYKILKRYDLSRQDIERMNYVISYPQ